MGIFDRMGKVISSNVNSLLDGAEDDRKLVELNIEEMNDQVKRAHKEVIAAVASEKQLRMKAAELTEEAAKWERRAELALKAGDESLAREALKQRKRVLTDAEQAENARSVQRDTALTMKEEYERMKAKLAEVKMRKGSIVARAQTSRAAGGEGLGAKPGSSAFSNFRKMEERIEGREAEASAMDEVNEALGQGKSAEDLEAQFRELERGSAGKAAAKELEIDSELEALKQRIRI